MEHGAGSRELRAKGAKLRAKGKKNRSEPGGSKRSMLWFLSAGGKPAGGTVLLTCLDGGLGGGQSGDGYPEG